MRIQLAHHVKGIPPQEARRWWSDFQEGRGDHAWLPGTRRTIVARAPTHVTMEDETRLAGVRVFHEVTTARFEPDAIHIEGANGLASFRGAYRFAAEDGGTRVELDAEVELRPGLAWTTFAARPLVHAILMADLAGHAKDLRRHHIPR